MLKTIVTIENVKTNIRPISKHLDDNRINIYIDEAEHLDLKPQLGESLFIDLKEFINDVPATERTSGKTFGTDYPDYDLLLTGGIYKKSESVYKEFAGLRTALEYYVYARLVKNNNYTVTRFGFVNKEDQYSQQSDLKERLVSEKDARSIADTYMNDCLEYIRMNSDQFKAFGCGKQKNRLRISIIGE